MNATLDAAQETTCGTESTAGGQLIGHLDPFSRRFDWWVAFGNNGFGPDSNDGLLQGTETVSHFHGPASSGFTGPIQITTGPTGTPKSGSQVLSPAQATQIKTGQWYYDIASNICPTGEIRGQLNYTMPVPGLSDDGRILAVLAIVVMATLLYWRMSTRSARR